MKYFNVLLLLIFYCYHPLFYGDDIKKTDPKINPLLFDQTIFEWTKSFAEVVHLIHSKYHEVINPEKAMINAINAFVSTLDPHSCFMDPKAFKEIIEATQGEFFGIGVVIDNMKEPEQEFLKIIDTLPTGPADKAGIKSDDVIVQINDITLKGMTVEEIIAKLKGKRNTTVDITIKRGNNPELLSFTLTRDIVKEQDALCYYFKDNNIYYLSLRMFTENSLKQLEQLFNKCQSQDCKGIILDLRNNSGGLLNSVVDIAGLFLPKNSLVVSTKERSHSMEYKTNRDPIKTNNFPIFILINNFTASAAEILAGCLQIHSNNSSNKESYIPHVFLVGSKTFGKGSVQEVIPVPNDCAAKITTSLYYLPNNTSIQSIGIEPDFIIEPRFPAPKELQWFNKNFGHESSLKNAIKNNDSSHESKKESTLKKDSEKTWQEKKQEQISSDYIILSTVRLMEMLTMVKKAFPNRLKTRQESIECLKKNFLTNDTIQLVEIKI